jgi:hypothetical protein
MIDASYEDDHELLDTKTTSHYRSMAGALLFVANTARPDVAFSAAFAARSMSKPTVAALIAIKRIWAYMSGTKDRGIIYSCSAICARDLLPHLSRLSMLDIPIPSVGVICP